MPAKKETKPQKMYKDYLEEHTKKCKEQGLDPVGDRLSDYYFNKR